PCNRGLRCHCPLAGGHHRFSPRRPAGGEPRSGCGGQGRPRPDPRAPGKRYPAGRGGGVAGRGRRGPGQLGGGRGQPRSGCRHGAHKGLERTGNPPGADPRPHRLRQARLGGGTPGLQAGAAEAHRDPRPGRGCHQSPPWDPGNRCRQWPGTVPPDPPEPPRMARRTERRPGGPGVRWPGGKPAPPGRRRGAGQGPPDRPGDGWRIPPGESLRGSGAGQQRPGRHVRGRPHRPRRDSGAGGPGPRHRDQRRPQLCVPGGRGWDPRPGRAPAGGGGAPPGRSGGGAGGPDPRPAGGGGRRRVPRRPRPGANCRRRLPRCRAMSMATWSIRNPIPAILLFAMLTVAGLWGFSQLTVESMPDMELPVINVSLRQPGAAPVQLETEVARKVEDSLATLPGLRHQRTTVTDGSVQLGLDFELDKPPCTALIETTEAIDRIRADLPESLEEPPVSALSVSGITMMTFAVSSTRMDEGELSWFIDDRVARKVLGVPGVGSFKRVGGLSREIRVAVSPAQLNGLGITAAQVSRGLRAVQQQLSGGRGQLGDAEQSVRTVATVERASDLRALPVVLNNGQAVRLDQIATIEDGFAERQEMALLDGKPVVGFQVYRAKGHDEVRTAAAVEAVLKDMAEADDSLRFELISSTADHTREQYQGSMLMLYEGALLAVLVVWFFLRDWRATLLAASALPLSVIPTFAAMHWLGFSLNTITLLSLALIVGILVDDAIVEIEN